MEKLSKPYNRILERHKRKGLYICTKVGLNEEIFYFLMILLGKASIIKGVGGKCFKFS